MKKVLKNFHTSGIVLFAFFLTEATGGVSKKPLLINGAGASFPYILYSKWFAEYQKVDPSVLINYRSIGSGGGIRQFLTGTLFFGATDVPVREQTLQKFKTPVMHLPTTLGAVVISHNVKELQNRQIKLNADTLAQIYMGKIKKWNHRLLQSLNPHLPLPDQSIVPIYRADGSGTTAVFTEYLSLFSKEWLKTSGKGKAVYWPVGLGGKGNEGVTGLIQKIPGALGYIAMSYALGQNLPTAQIQNSSGHFVQVTLSSVSKAAEQAWKSQPDWLQPLTRAKGPRSYPLAAYTYLLISRDMNSQKGRAFLKFLHWSLKEGQTFCKPLYYAPLPPPVVQKIQQKLKSVQTI